MPWSVEGKVAVVTGATSAMGRHIAARLASTHKMKLVCVSRKAFSHPLPTGSVAMQADVCAAQDCDELFRRVRSEVGPVSVLVNCAGITVSKVFVRNTPEDFDAVLNTNVKGALYVTKAALRHGGLLTVGGGSVVHIGSVVGSIGNEGQVVYAASKAALSGAAKSWAKEYGTKNVRFNVVAPGLVDGEGMGETLTPQQRQHWQAMCPLGRLATAEEVAEVAVWTALSTYVNGQTIHVDGGCS